MDQIRSCLWLGEKAVEKFYFLKTKSHEDTFQQVDRNKDFYPILSHNFWGQIFFLEKFKIRFGSMGCLEKKLFLLAWCDQNLEEISHKILDLILGLHGAPSSTNAWKIWKYDWKITFFKGWKNNTLTLDIR